MHHGGAGTTSAGLRAGKPGFVIPYFADQHFWASRVYDLGAGPKPVRRKKLTTEVLAAGLRDLVSNQSIQSQAADIGEKIRHENGIKQAIRHLSKLI